jgi:putative transposase
MIQTAERLAEAQGVAAACTALGVPRSSLYRERLPATVVETPAEPPVRPAPPRALSPMEQEQVREVLNSERFQDLAPREVYAQLLDDEQYLCSWRTMYRILEQHDEVRERRNQLRHPAYAKPELMATSPNKVWSWDISKLRGPSKGLYYYLYVIIDIFSRYVVGWMIAELESAELAEQLIGEACVKQGVQRAQLTVHADNGSPMIAKSVATLLADLGVAKSHSRPHVSNDNPYSEAQFKTLKYHPDYPERFGSVPDARNWARTFFHWYNHEHHHTGLGLLTPADVHAGQAEAIRQKRQAVLQRAFEAHPERFVNGVPRPDELPQAVWINPPKPGTPAPRPEHPVVPAECVAVADAHDANAHTLASPAVLSYTPNGGTEDSATLRSDMSADPVDSVAGQSRANAALPVPCQKAELHCPESDKPKPTVQRALAKPATTGSVSLSEPPQPQTRTLNSR